MTNDQGLEKMLTQTSKNQNRRHIHERIRKKILGTAERPRLNVYRSLNHIYVQLIDDLQGATLVSANSAEGEKGQRRTGGNLAAAKAVGKNIAERAQAKGITKVAFNRVTKVVKGGKNLSFAALVVVGDPSAAVVGYGSGKAKEVPQAIRKGIESAKKNLMRVNLTQTSIPHLVLGRFGSGRVLLKPAPEGTGVIAGGAVRAVMTSAGIQNVLTKSIGTTNPHNVIKATFDALKHLKNRSDVAAMRGKSVEEL